MKRIILFLVFAGYISAFGGGFRSVEWGADIETIKKSEGGMGLEKTKKSQRKGRCTWEFDLYTFEDSLRSAGKFQVQYILLKDRLIQGSYSQELKGGNLDNYNKIRVLLEEKYGYPQEVYETRSFTFSDVRRDTVFKEIFTWHTTDTQIDLVLLKGQEFQINYYTRDRDLVDFILDTGLEEERKRKENLIKDNEFIKNKI